jgi:exonuclease SbcD
VLTAHLFCTGSQKEGSESDIELGTARLVPKEIFPSAHYTALGHIHKPQFVSRSRNIYYSGAIMQYSFDEENQQKSAAVIDVTAAGVREFKTVPLMRSRRLLSLTADSAAEGEAGLEKHADSIVSLTLTLTESLKASEARAIKAHENLYGLRLVLPERGKEKAYRPNRTEREIFEDFLLRARGVKPSEELLELYLEMLGEPQ